MKRVQVMKFLLDEGLDVNVQDSSGSTPLAWLELAGSIKNGEREPDMVLP